MSEKPEALLRRQHADNISVAHMKIRIERLEAENERLHDELRQSSIDITLAEVERLKAENERLRSLLAEAKDLAWSFGADSLFDRIDAALRREDV